MMDYEQIISKVVCEDEASIYIYWYAGTPYISVVSIVQDSHWLIMFALNGILESAFVIENPDSYLSKPEFEALGSVREVLE